MDNARMMTEELRYEHMGRDGDPVCDLPARAPLGYGGAEVSDPATGPLWLGLVALTVCVAGGFAVGLATGAWLALGM